jgi:hypothetical protein
MMLSPKEDLKDNQVITNPILDRKVKNQDNLDLSNNGKFREILRVILAM